MILRDFVYARPDTKEEAVSLYEDFQRQGLTPLYYAGGSEIITMCRLGSIGPGAVIDIKSIAEVNQLHMAEDVLTIGGCVSLRAIHDSGLYPLMGSVAGRIADHTNQCRITLGGNLCGTIIYRETVQPLLLCDAALTLFGPQGVRTAAICDVFGRHMQLLPGEMVLAVQIPRQRVELEYCHVKKTANEKIDYPLISVSAIQYEGAMRFAFSGVVPYPFRSRTMEAALNEVGVPAAQRIEEALSRLPNQPMTDHQGSGEYRQFVLRRTLEEILEVWKS